MAKPGVMFYFEVRPCIKRLTFEEKGQLFEAILDYGEFGVVPELSGAVGVAWDFLQPKLDRDSERYEQQMVKLMLKLPQVMFFKLKDLLETL